MGLVFDIQKFCTRDGPGIRTTVFLKGCPLNCIWCHNPESRSPKPELLYNSEKCIACGRCVPLCPHGCHHLKNGVHTMDHSKCVGCFACVGCSALRPVGRDMTVEQVLERVAEDVPFYGDDGGMTVSGGEPFYQYEFLFKLLKAAKEQGIHTAVETSGFAPRSHILAAAAFVDVFLYDFKVSDKARYKALIGADDALIRSNLAALGKIGANIILRCPIIPGANLAQSHAQAIAAIANENPGIREINLEPYHALGLSKSAQLGKESDARFSVPDGPAMDEFVAWIQEGTAIPVIVI